MAKFDWRMIDDGTYCLTRYIGNDKDVTIPSNVTITVIFDDMFKGHTELQSLTFPDTVLEIGGFIVDGCVNLKEVRLPSGLQTFWQYSFARCGIESIVIPGSVKQIVPFVFHGCGGLSSVVINEGTERIHSWAFKDCHNLMDVHIPSTVNHVSEHAFDGCPNVVLHHRRF